VKKSLAVIEDNVIEKKDFGGGDGTKFKLFLGR